MIYYITSNGKPFVKTDDFNHAFKLLCDYQDLKDGNIYDIKKDFEMSKDERF